MTFLDFAHQHGLIVDHLIADGLWHRCATQDHPRKRNGVYSYREDHGFVRNWATMTQTAMWQGDRPGGTIHLHQRPAAITHALKKAQERAREAATALLRDCTRATHPYLARKGFPALEGLVHAPTGDLIVPMRDCCNYATINSVQKINLAGEKKFLPGGKAKGSIYEHVVGGCGRPSRWLCEGYATGLSIAAAARSMYLSATMVVCFSAGNLEYVASRIKADYVFADHDESGAGERAAKATGLPYCMAPMVGDDANDLMQRAGIRGLAAVMLELMNRSGG